MLDMDSFMSLYLRAVALSGPKVTDSCLMVVFEDVTELLVQRDGLPQSSTFMEGGSRSVIGDPSAAPNTAVPAQYEQKLAKLFGRTNDGLSLPKNIFLHAPAAAERVLAGSVQQAARAATGTNHQVFSAPATFFSAIDLTDANWRCLAFVYQKKLYEDHHLAEVQNMLK